MPTKDVLNESSFLLLNTSVPAEGSIAGFSRIETNKGDEDSLGSGFLRLRRSLSKHMEVRITIKKCDLCGQAFSPATSQDKYCAPHKAMSHIKRERLRDLIQLGQEDSES